jgi:hypothetical protein
LAVAAAGRTTRPTMTDLVTAPMDFVRDFACIAALL